jgi:branched-subunit amino acid ABC-type transport system permease component
MVGAYVALSVAKYTGSFVMGILAGGLCAAVIGFAMERGLLRRLYKRELDQVLFTIGLVYPFCPALFPWEQYNSPFFDLP